ncbi:CAP domain-containing protein [Streptomyces sp. NPDC006459]|uniref:CAP domain-containing protein n=1 Tax=Streptomyces sp. NPDC006459 TaxID=3154303 RepID=UPI0033BDDADC
MSSRTPGTPSRVEARRKKTVRTRIVLSLTAAAAVVAVGVAVADSDGGTQVDQRADGATGPKSGTPAPTGSAGSAAPASPSPEITAEAAAATGSPLPPETPAAGGTESAAPEKSAADGGAPAKSTPASKPPRTSGGSTGGGSGSSGGSGGSSGGSTGGSSGGSGSGSSSESAVLALVNKERSAAGCGPVTMNAKLSAAARGYSDTMARSGVMSHTGPDGSTMTTRVEAAGYAWSRLGENIARGQSDADAVMKAWMNSSGHRANILNCDFKEIGIGFHKGDGGPWWTQNFGAPR